MVSGPVVIVDYDCDDKELMEDGKIYKHPECLSKSLELFKNVIQVYKLRLGNS